MKKILSLLLTLTMLLSITALPVSATEAGGNWNSGTLVYYNAADPDGDGVLDNTESYTVTVPAQLAPGTGGDVLASGTWPSNRILVVTAEESVRLINSINADNYKDLAVTFNGMAVEGSNISSISETEPVSVAAISNAIFGKWEGVFKYNVSIIDNPNKPTPDDPMDGSVYYNQPYNAIVTSGTFGTRSATQETVMSMVLYDDHALEIFQDGVLVDSFPAGSVAIDGRSATLGEDVIEFSDDFTEFAANGLTYKLNTTPSSLHIGTGHVYSGYTYDNTPDDLMAFGAEFKNGSRIDVYYNGVLFGESSTEYFTIDNMVFLRDEGEEPVAWAYVSIDGSQLIQRGYAILTCQESHEETGLQYGKAYSNFIDLFGTGEVAHWSVIPYRDGSFDIIYNYAFVGSEPEGSFSIEGNKMIVNSQSLGQLALEIENDGRTIASYDSYVCIGFITGEHGVEFTSTEIAYGIVEGGVLSGVLQFNDDGRTCTIADLNGNVEGICDYIASQDALILSCYPILLRYDNTTGELSQTITFEDNGEMITAGLQLIPIAN